MTYDAARYDNPKMSALLNSWLSEAVKKAWDEGRFDLTLYLRPGLSSILARGGTPLTLEGEGNDLAIINRTYGRRIDVTNVLPRHADHAYILILGQDSEPWCIVIEELKHGGGIGLARLERGIQPQGVK